MTKENEVRKSFFDQAEICAALGSTFMEHLCKGLGQHLDKSTKTGTRILEWQGDPSPKGDALALRLAGGIHAIIRRNHFPRLQEFYDQTTRSKDADFIVEIMALIAAQDTQLLTWLDNTPQTNEVARSSIIFAGLSVIAQKFRKPLDLYEPGASGGLNLQVADFNYTYDGKNFGTPNSTLHLHPQWQGTLPPNVHLDIRSKSGCDLNPLFVETPEDCEKLVAYLWPDQPKRIERVKTAIEIARKSPPKLDKADAADWVEQIFANTSPGNSPIKDSRTKNNEGTVRVLFHTIAQNYFPKSVTRRIRAAVENAGQQATRENPIAWLSFEFDGEGDPKLKLRTWPDGETQILATADPHVNGVKWI